MPGHLLAHPAVHHAITQAVRIVSMPADQLEAQGVRIAQATLNYARAAFWVGIAALVIGFAALGIALGDAMNNSRQLRIALARPKFDVDVTAELIEVIKDPRLSDSTATLNAMLFHYNIKNIGDKATEHYELTIYFPLSLCCDVPPYTGERRTIGDIEHKVIHLRTAGGYSRSVRDLVGGSDSGCR